MVCLRLAQCTQHKWEDMPSHSEFEGDYGSYDSLNHLFRQIGYDEVIHRDESAIMMTQPRYR